MNEKIISSAPEWLLLEGLISTDGRFSLLSGRIQQRVRLHRAKEAVESKHHSLRLLDAKGDTLVEAPAIVQSPTICHEFAPTHQLLSCGLPLVPDAESVAIQRQGQEIFRSPIGAPPRLSVSWPKRRLQRGKKHKLELKWSKPANPGEALLILAIHWGGDRHRIIGISELAESLSFDPAMLPGDRSCRLSVTYRSGFRSKTLFSPRLSLTPLPPRIRMLKPREGATFIAGAPISLVAEVDDPQGDRGLAAALRWSVDGKAVGSSPQALLTDLVEGEYTLKLAIEGHKEAVIERGVKIVALPAVHRERPDRGTIHR